MNASLSQACKSLRPFLERLAASAWLLVSRQGIWQTKNLLFVGWTLFFVGGSGFLVLSEKNRVPFVLTSAYVAFSILAYWVNEALFIRPGIPSRLWKKHVIDPRRNRISVAFMVRIQELGYLILMFFGWFLFAGNIIYRSTDSSLTREWLRAVVHMISSAGIQTNRSYHAEGPLGILLTVATSVFGLGFIGAWIGIIIEDHVYVMGKDDKNGVERAQRCRFVDGRHRTNRLRRSRRGR
jgi:hypothetical protein